MNGREGSTHRADAGAVHPSSAAVREALKRKGMPPRLFRDLVQGAAVVGSEPVALVVKRAHAGHEAFEAACFMETVEGGCQGCHMD